MTGDEFKNKVVQFIESFSNYNVESIKFTLADPFSVDEELDEEDILGWLHVTLINYEETTIPIGLQDDELIIIIGEDLDQCDNLDNNGLLSYIINFLIEEV